MKHDIRPRSAKIAGWLGPVASGIGIVFWIGVLLVSGVAREGKIWGCW